MADTTVTSPAYRFFHPLGATFFSGAGILLCGLAALISDLSAKRLALTPVLVFIGLVLAGVAISWKFRYPLGETWHDRLEPALFICGTMHLSCIFSYTALNYAAVVPLPGSSWDSICALLLVMLFVGTIGVCLILFSTAIRKVLLSLFVLLHFTGILTAVTAVPAGSQVPWLPTQIWTHFYRPYLSFIYLNNAYHFYSPEPGPPTLVWFRIEYSAIEDGEEKIYTQWVRLAERKDCATRLQYQRLLALTESVNKPQQASYAKISALATRRDHIEHAAARGRPPEWWRTDERPKGIELYPGLDPSAQYSEPNEMSRLYLSSYVNHVAKHYPYEDNPKAKVKAIQVYKLIHNIALPSQISRGYDPLDPAMYKVYFFGRYTPDGTLIAPRMTPEDEQTHPQMKYLVYQDQNGTGQLVQRREPIQDLYLYWLLPVYREPKVRNPDINDFKDWKLIDGLEKHTGDTRERLWNR